MSQILSDKEIEALQKALATNEIEIDQDEENKVVKYDFVFQKRLTPKLAAILNVIFSRFIVNLRASLSLRLRRVVRTELLNFDYQKYSDFIEALPPVCWIEQVEIQPSNGLSLLIFNPDLAVVLIDLLCGGSGKVTFNKDSFSSFAPLEQALMRNIIELTLADLQTAWQSVIPGVQLISKGSEFNPQLLTGFSPDDSFTIIPLKITIGEFSGNMAFCIPHYTIEPFKQQFETKKEEGLQEIDPNAVTKIIENLLDTELELKVELGQKKVTLRDILNLETGQMLDLNKSIDDEVIVKVEGVSRFKGYPVQVKGNKAVKISEILVPIPIDEKKEEKKHGQSNTQGPN